MLPSCLRFLIASALVATADHALADAADEHAQLSLTLKQLQAAEQVASRAERAANTPDRFRFDYDRLRLDLQQIEQGLRDYLSPTRAQPADPLPLDGGYTRDAAADARP